MVLESFIFSGIKATIFGDKKDKDIVFVPYLTVFDFWGMIHYTFLNPMALFR